MAKKKKNKRKKKLTVESIRSEHKRKDMKDAGVYDGRYRPRVVKDKNKYDRKDKHRGRREE